MTIYPISNLSAEVPGHPRAVALGMFDGLHSAHRAVIARAVGVDGCSAAVFTFAGSPEELPKQARELCTEEEKQALLRSMGVDELFAVRFETVRQLSPEAFVRQVLRDKLGARRVCCGENFRFGRDAAGDVSRLRALCAQEGIEVCVVPTLYCDGAPVSSTRIRACVEQGDLRLASRLLGRPFTLKLPVTYGRQVGRQWGFPTLNQVLPAAFVRPRFGVYVSSVTVDGQVWPGVTNIGVHPTVGATRPVAETYLPGYEGDLYGRTIPVTPVRLLRPERSFPSVDALKAQIASDTAEALRAFSPIGRTRAVLFDFDDTLQDRPAAWRKYAEWFVPFHFPALPPDAQRRRAQEMWERDGNGHGHVDYAAYFQGLIDLWQWRDAPSVEQLVRECKIRFAACATLFPDAVPVLQALRERGYLLGLVTNGSSLMQNRKLDCCGIRPLFDGVLVTGDEGIHKPRPEPFLRIASRLGVAPADCVYVGDHPVNDIQGAHNAGMRPVLLSQDTTNRPAGVPVVGSLSALLDIL